MNDNPSRLLNSSREYVATTSNGYLMLALLIVLVAVVGESIVAFSLYRAGSPMLTIVICTLLSILVVKGFYVLQPNEAAAIMLFGAYWGTDRATGLRWIW